MVKVFNLGVAITLEFLNETPGTNSSITLEFDGPMLETFAPKFDGTLSAIVAALT